MTSEADRQTIRVLVIEDSESDFLLILRQLEKAGFEADARRVQTRGAMLAALATREWDVILSDHSLPHFSAPEALAALQETGLDFPFIIVSGAVGEEAAVACMKAGAHDYIKKDDLARLGVAIEREVREAEMRKQQRLATSRLRTAQRIAQLGFWEWNIWTDEIFVSDEAFSVLGLAPGSVKMTYHALLERVEPGDRDAVQNRVERAVRGGGSYQIDHGIALPDGTVRFVQQQGEVQTNEAGDPVRVAGTFMDITERKRAQQELEHQRSRLTQAVEERTRELRDAMLRLTETSLRLQQASQHKSRFLSSMSHELRTPLNAILGFTDLLKGRFYGELNDKQAEYVDRIEEGGRHLLELINDLLDVSKIDAGAMELERAPTAVAEFVRSTAGMMRQQFQDKGLDLVLNTGPNLPTVKADARKCRQIMLNLLSNALKFTPRGGRVEVRAEQKGPELVIEVEDTGPGIEEEEQTRIFSEFHQADRIRDENLGGTGIGLALVRRLVRLHGGRVGVRSEVGRGSTFWFALPVRPHGAPDGATGGDTQLIDADRVLDAAASRAAARGESP